MERLTHYDEDGRIYSSRGWEVALSHLAAYEDTGLSPADIADLKNEHCLLCGKYKKAHEGSCDSCRWKKGAHE